jgi:fermentation-respiration switch protein FrsA (DUF1100 family)
MMKGWIRFSLLFILLIAVINFAKSYFVSLFFYPDNVVVGSPKNYGVPYEEVSFPAKNGNTLFGYFFKSKGPVRGTVVHCHGNAGNVTEHFPQALFLCAEGYNVLAFDYEGFGQSQGKPSPEGVVQDTLAALDYVRTRPDVDKNRIALFGQSLGGAAAAEAMAADKTVKCLLLEGTFTTYREMAWATPLGRMLFFVTPFFIPDRGPLKDLPKIAPRPVLILHGDADGKIPVRFAYRLYNKAKETKSLVIIKGFHHLQGSEGEPEYDLRILNFLKAYLV